MIRRLRDFIESQETVEKKLFWIVTLTCLGGSLYSSVILFLDQLSFAASIISLFCSLFFFLVMVVCHSTQRHQDCYLAMCLILNCILLPVLFFFCGGAYSGIPVYFVLGIFLCALCLEKTRTLIATSLSVFAMIASILLGYTHQDWVLTVSMDFPYRSALVSFCLVSVCIFAISLYVQKQYKNQRYKEINNGIIDILGTVVEFRSVEAGDHIKRIKGFTRILLGYVNQVYDDRHLTAADIAIISSASAMHDVGKIAIPDGILLKGGPLTSAERLVMQKHTTRGCEIINSMREIQDQDYYKYGYEICRHHHERYDGNGYPDHLKGEEIPLSAQVVALADVYDALVNERCYKPAYTFEQSFQMIMKGDCGVFSPRLLKCLELAKNDMEIFNMAMQQSVITVSDEPQKMISDRKF